MTQLVGFWGFLFLCLVTDGTIAKVQMVSVLHALIVVQNQTHWNMWPALITRTPQVLMASTSSNEHAFFKNKVASVWGETADYCCKAANCIICSFFNALWALCSVWSNGGCSDNSCCWRSGEWCGHILWSVKKNVHFLIIQVKNVLPQIVETKSLSVHKKWLYLVFGSLQ